MMGYPAEFEAFWAAYPKRIGPNPKAAAAKVFAKLTRVISPGDLTRAAKAYAAECVKLKVDPAFIPHARTWLSQERWTDYLGTPEAATQAAAGELPPLYHQLRARRPDLTAAVWKAWLAALDIQRVSLGAIIIAPSAFHRQRVETDWGSDLGAIFGRILWRVAK